MPTAFMTTVPNPAAGSTAPAAVPAPGGVVPSQERPRRRRWRVVLAVVVLVLLGVEVFLAAPTLGGAVTALGGARPWWVAAAVLAEAVSMDLFARLRRTLLAAAGVPVRMRDSRAAVYVANALHMTVPGGAAFSTVYAYRWMRGRGAGPTATTWTLVAGGVISTCTLAALAVAGSLLAGASAGLPALGVDAAVVVGLVAGVRKLRRRPDLALAIGRRLLAWRNRLLRRPPRHGVDAFDGLVRQLRWVRPGARDWAVASAYGLGNWVFDLACLAASTAALGVRGVTPALLLVAYTAGMAASGISLLPGGIGVVDTAMALTLVAGGVPAVTALPAVLLYRLISLVAVVTAGWLIAAVQSRRSRARPAWSRPARPDRFTARRSVPTGLLRRWAARSLPPTAERGR